MGYTHYARIDKMPRRTMRILSALMQGLDIVYNVNAETIADGAHSGVSFTEPIEMLDRHAAAVGGGLAVEKSVFTSDATAHLGAHSSAPNNKTPLISNYEANFNGTHATDPDADFGHETFHLSIDTSGFWFCKTARKPYDAAVCGMLAVAEAVSGSKIRVSSDGDPEEWIYACELASWILRNLSALGIYLSGDDTKALPKEVRVPKEIMGEPPEGQPDGDGDGDGDGEGELQDGDDGEGQGQPSPDDDAEGDPSNDPDYGLPPSGTAGKHRASSALD